MSLTRHTQKHREALTELEKKYGGALEQLKSRQEGTDAPRQDALMAQIKALQELVETERASALEALQTVASVEADSQAKIRKAESRHTAAFEALRKEYRSRANVLLEFWNEIEGLPENDDTARYLRILQELLEDPSGGT